MLKRIYLHTLLGNKIIQMHYIDKAERDKKLRLLYGAFEIIKESHV